jgi:hypothetical protein
MTLMGAGKSSTGAPAYSGPGDQTTFLIWGSVASPPVHLRGFFVPNTFDEHPFMERQVFQLVG